MSPPTAPPPRPGLTTAAVELDVDRERRIVESFVALTDTVLAEDDPPGYLAMFAARCLDLLDVGAADVLLSEPGSDGRLSLASATCERSGRLEQYAVENDSGPMVAAARAAATITCPDFAAPVARRRWPGFAACAQATGYRAAHVVPLRRGGHLLGVLSLLHSDVHILSRRDARLAQAMADTATVALLH